MNFFSLEFFSYFILAFSFYWLISPFPRVQNAFLLVISYCFVGWFSPSSALILFDWSIAIYLLALVAERSLSLRATSAILATMVLAIFSCFKYYPALREGIQQQLTAWNMDASLPVLDVLMPLGLSFYVFNSVSYVISVQRKEIPPGDLLSAMLYLSFFATIVAGPINRATHLIPQIATQAPRKPEESNKAILLIALAVTKLFFFSSWLDNAWVQPVFSTPQEATAGQTLLAVYAWAWEIYFNFSGYTNLVTGIALLLGFRVSANFAHPYLATTPGEFWRRWHISLSTFIRDYVYIPLGGSRNGFATTQRNVLIAMVLSGIWHGAGLTYAVWGLIHGLGLIAHNLWRRRNVKPRLNPALTALWSRLAMFHFVCFAWIFFRASDMGSALTLLDKVTTLDGSWLDADIYLPLLAFLALLVTYPALVAMRHKVASFMQGMTWYLLPVPVTLLLACVFFFAPAGVPGFIYANF